MRRLAAAAIMVLLSACDDKHAMPGGGAREMASSATLPPAAPVAPATAKSSAEDGGAKSALKMPERPIAKPDNTVGSGMPIDVQQKAIAYFMAMKAPRPDDANADPAYAAELATKLRPIILSMDTGPDKARMNRVEVQANGRQIDLLMSGGCDEKTPFRAVTTRAGVPLATLVSHGVFVVRCNDAKWQCLQSTRDPDDVLCATGIRHK